MPHVILQVCGRMQCHADTDYSMSILPLYQVSFDTKKGGCSAMQTQTECV